MFSNSEKAAKLILADGTEFVGRSIGKEGTTIGEIVFTTSMTGYLETLTDASYFGQIVIQTFPLVGNYGINKKDYEGKKPWVNGYIVKNLCETPSNIGNEENLNSWLLKNEVVGIEGLDTRKLTKKIRENGVLNGAITTENIKNKEEFLEKIRNFKIKDAIKTTSTKEVEEIDSCYEGAKDLKICVFDFGIKKSIVENIKKRFKKVFVLPYNATKSDIEKINPDGIVLSNGPGDPEDNKEDIENLKEIEKLNIPIFGICMGHQLLALCNGFKTEKLKYGHRGANQPVLDLTVNKIKITSQNHGYCVVSDSVKEDVAKVSHVNVNDKTCEGLKYLKIPAFSVQFHPEASAGPKDTNFLFDRFLELVEKNKKK